MFGSSGQVTDAQIEFVSSGAATIGSGPGGYAVYITQNRSCDRVSGSLSEGITVTERLTFNSVCTVELVEGMSLQYAADTMTARFQLFGLDMSAGGARRHSGSQPHLIRQPLRLLCALQSGRRIGRLGVGWSSRGAKCAVHWSGRSKHHQRRSGKWQWALSDRQYGQRHH